MIFALLLLIALLVGDDDGSTPADHRPAAQGRQHQWPRDEKGKTPSMVQTPCVCDVWSAFVQYITFNH